MMEAFRQHPRILLAPRMSTLFVWWNVLFPWLDLAYTLCFIPGVILACFGVYWVAGPMTLVLLPFWTSILVKSFAFTVLLGEEGIINNVARALFGPDTALKMLFNRPGVVIGMAHYLLPFMIFAILTSLLAQNPDLRRAAEVMGAGRARIFRSVTLPLSMPGVIAGCLISVVLSLGMFVTPALLGGPKDMMLANLVEMHVRQTLDWGLAAALTVLLIILTALLSALISRVRGGGLTAHG